MITLWCWPTRSVRASSYPRFGEQPTSESLATSRLARWTSRITATCRLHRGDLLILAALAPQGAVLGIDRRMDETTRSERNDR